MDQLVNVKAINLEYFTTGDAYECTVRTTDNKVQQYNVLVISRDTDYIHVVTHHIAYNTKSISVQDIESGDIVLRRLS